jgi:hypothetical protein
VSDGPHTIKLSAHPRASRHIAAAKGWGGLVGFALVLLLSLKAGTTPFEAGVRALAGGMGLYLLAWFGAVMIWRELAVAEVAAAKRRMIEQSLAAQEAAEAARAALAAQQPPADVA